MRANKTIDLDDDLAVTIRELTVGDIRAWLRRLESSPPPTGEGLGERGFDLLSAALIDGHDLADLALLTYLTPMSIEALTPGQIRRVFDVAREVNADFFVMRARLAEIGQAALAAAP